MNAGWYIHHHGTGHLQRFKVMRAHLPELVGLSSLPRPDDVPAAQWVALPDDAPAGPDSDPQAGGALHWAPIGHPGLRRRMALIAQWLQEAAPDVLVVDVSVEVAALARLMGTPVVWVGQRGRRTDAPHQLAYELSRVVVPWTEAVDSPAVGLPGRVRHVGALSRFDGREPLPRPGRRHVVLLLGAGGHEVDPAQVRAAQAATPQWAWNTAGLEATQHRDANAVWALLQDADVVIGSAGTNVVAEVAAARRPLICLPQPRPFDEQIDQAGALQRAGMALTVSRWPEADRWPALLATATAQDPERWSGLHDGHGAQRMADAITELACASG